MMLIGTLQRPIHFNYCTNTLITSPFARWDTFSAYQTHGVWDIVVLQFFLNSLRTDDDFCTKGGTQKLPQKFKIVELNLLTWPFIGKLLRSTFWWHHWFREPTILGKCLFWIFLWKSRSLMSLVHRNPEQSLSYHYVCNTAKGYLHTEVMTCLSLAIMVYKTLIVQPVIGLASPCFMLLIFPVSCHGVEVPYA
jgi:hypothetical protein